MESIPKKSGIYQIRNLVNDKVYVGSAVNLHRRKREHFTRLENNKHPNIKLQRAYNKYGSNNFIFEVIEIVDNKEFILSREQYYIDHLNVVNEGYNINPTAGSNLGMQWSDEVKAKISNTLKGNIPWNKGLTNTCQKGRIPWNKGKSMNLSSESINIKREKGRNTSLCKKVICLETGDIFKSASEAAKVYECCNNNISACCTGRRKTAGGYHWKYVD